MNAWVRFHRIAWWWRWPLKLLLFGVVCLLALYPRVWLIPTWLHRLENMDSVIDPDCPGLEPLLEAARRAIPADATPAQRLAIVQKLVVERIPYAWDWDVWGVIDYLPTTAEVLAKGREDCDGRAVLAASLLRRLGYEAHLACDLKHTWVVTPQGETMSPGKGEKTATGGPGGTRIRVSPGLLANVGRALSFGVAVFPIGRELLILVALLGLTAHPYAGRWRMALSCALLVGALVILRTVGARSESSPGWTYWTFGALALIVVGWIGLAIKAGASRSTSTPPESPATRGAGRDQSPGTPAP